jgi:hypothetical protein
MEITTPLQNTSNKTVVNLVEEPLTNSNGFETKGKRGRADDSVDSDDEPILKLFQNDLSNEATEDIDAPTAELLTQGDEQEDDDVQAEKKRRELEKKAFDGLMEKQKMSRLKFLLEKTTLYSSFLSQKVSLPDSVAKDKPISEKPKTNGKSNGRSKKRKIEENLDNGKEEVNLLGSILIG